MQTPEVTKEPEVFEMRFTVDYPSLYWELLDHNLHLLGSSITGLTYTLMNLENMYRIAKRQGNQEILKELAYTGIDENYFAEKEKRYAPKVKRWNKQLAAAKRGEVKENTIDI